MKEIHHWIDGKEAEGGSGRFADVFNPATGEVQAKVALARKDELDAAVASAAKAQLGWGATNPQRRARVMMKFVDLLNRDMDKLAESVSREHGKTLPDGAGDVQRGLEVIEVCMGAPNLLKGEFMDSGGPGIDLYSMRQPLGVVAGITPFNFPAMIPLWMFPLAIAAGNTFVLKPSEQDPMTPTRLAELFQEAGAAPGLLQVVHGGKEQVDTLLTHPDIKAVSFVGSVPVGQHVYRTATEHLKRAQCFAGAKNHMVIMPDAKKEQVISSLVGSSCGAAGQRCMAISVAVFVGDSKAWIDELKDEFAKIRPGAWNDPDAAYGPQISPQAKQRVLTLIKQGKEEGANCLLDGSECTVDGLPDGNWVGPTLFSGVTPEMSIYREEIFGPVLCCVTVDTLEEALELVNNSPYGNGTSIFTACGAAARKYQHEVEVGQVGINVPIPVPLPFFSFTGWKGSFYGDQHAYGKQAVRFYTETKTVTSRWFDSDIPAAGPNMSINLK